MTPLLLRLQDAFIILVVNCAVGSKASFLSAKIMFLIRWFYTLSKAWHILQEVIDIFLPSLGEEEGGSQLTSGNAALTLELVAVTEFHMIPLSATP